MSLEKIVNSLENIKKNARKTIAKFTLTAFLSASTIIPIGCCNPVTPPPPPPEQEIKEGTTDSLGEVVFEDKDTGEEVKIILEDDNGNRLPGINIIYYDGSDYEVFTALDPSGTYLPTRGIYPHNSRQILQTTRSEGTYKGIHKIGIIDDEDTIKAFYLWECNNGMWSEHIYKKTISKDERTQIGENYVTFSNICFKLSMLMFGVKPDSSLDISDIFNLIEKDIPNLPSRWDLYEYQGSELGNTVSNITFIPSNIPTIIADPPSVIDNRVDISWAGSDRTTYEDHIPYNYKQGFLPSNTDITVFLGPTKDSDLYYELRLFKEGPDGLKIIDRWRSLTTTSKTIDDLVNGNYAFEVCVFDEVGNGDISDMVPFTIGTQETNTIVLQPGPEGKDAYVHKYWVTDAYFEEVLSQYENDNYGNESYLYTGYFTRPTTDYYKYWRYATYMQFSLDQIPQNANINSAKLYTYSIVRVSGPDTPKSLEVKLMNIETPWNESTLTWNTRGSWGNEFESLVLSYNGNEYYWTEWDITDLVSRWHNSTLPNYGLVLDSTLGADYGPDYKTVSSDSSDTMYRPKLVIDYTQ